MTWPFCSQCGTILDPPVGSTICCDFCGHTCKFSEVSTSEVITYSAIRSRPPWLGEEDDHESSGPSASKGEKKDRPKHAKIEETCPKCGHPELYFYTMQLRAVDEGSTVFYECPKCSHTYSQNN